MQKPHRLWRYNEITGYWDYCRTCEDATAKIWFEVWQKDEPQTHFKLSRNRPNGAPKR